MQMGMQKPPLGTMSNTVWLRLRVHDLLGAIGWYNDAGIYVPRMFTSELREVLDFLDLHGACAVEHVDARLLQHGYEVEDCKQVDSGETENTKPPIWVKSNLVWMRQRVREILGAIERCNDTGRIPRRFVAELEEVLDCIDAHKGCV